MRFKILHTKDVHSRFENFARLTTKIKELKDENTLILDAGDYHDFKDVMLQGTGEKAGAELIIEICPSPLNPIYMEIQGKYIREALEQSLDSEICYKDGTGSGFRGRFLGRLHISGAIIEHDGNQINRIIVNGKELDEEKYYRVDTSDYLQRGTGYKTLANNINVRYM
ncbi:5'-nucleotidase C-terminal domain-containing protein [Clostridium sp.]|uniref:5'-nucleotidase C-terminal domain-containing protein n=1 Tax=Clostridium sp. TaxID=1506 RepID=UPI0025BE3236|nr:5'-nucleotidase C-terminal domain-containing protein [Clostridium sp.]